MRPAGCALLVLLLVSAGCSDDGRELEPPPAGATYSTTTTPTTTAPSTASKAMTLSPSSFAAGEAMPARFSCDGEGVSPALEWANQPRGAAELALVVTDPDAGGFVHWVVSGLDPTLNGIAEGALPEGAVEARNDAGRVGWAPVCPPSGEHVYVFALYAHAEPIGMRPALDAATASNLAKDNAIEAATFTATFSR